MTILRHANNHFSEKVRDVVFNSLVDFFLDLLVDIRFVATQFLGHNILNRLTNKEFMQTLVNCEGGLKLVLPAPAFAIRLIMGPRADLVLNSNRVVSSRLEKTGFAYHFQTLESALLDNLK